MKVPTKLLVGIRTTGNVALSVTTTATLPAQPPDLVILCGDKQRVIACSNNVWATTLGAGDHVLCMQAPGDSWFGEPVTFTLDAPATIVTPANPSVSSLTSWTGAAGTASNPKDPWPPPSANSTGSGPVANATWLSDTLTSWNDQVSVERSAPPYVPPARSSKRT